MAAWQNRPLDAVYPVILIDAIVVKIRDGQVANRPIYVAHGRQPRRRTRRAGAVGRTHRRRRRQVLDERCSPSCATAASPTPSSSCCDGLKGLPDAIRATWPLAEVQTCVVHLVRSSLRYTSKKHWGAVAAELREIYTAPTVEAAEAAFAEFAETLAGPVPGDDRHLGTGLGRVRRRSWTSRRAPRSRLHHQRHRVAQRPVPQARSATAGTSRPSSPR